MKSHIIVLLIFIIMLSSCRLTPKLKYQDGECVINTKSSQLYKIQLLASGRRLEIINLKTNEKLLIHQSDDIYKNINCP